MSLLFLIAYAVTTLRDDPLLKLLLVLALSETLTPPFKDFLPTIARYLVS